jgi:hypothetical protein
MLCEKPHREIRGPAGGDPVAESAKSPAGVGGALLMSGRLAPGCGRGRDAIEKDFDGVLTSSGCRTADGYWRVD